jgi:hypothetical protein
MVHVDLGRSTECRSDRTDVGLVAEKIVSKGGLLPDELMLKVVTSKLDALRHKVRGTDSDGSKIPIALPSIGYWMAFLGR